MAIYNKATLLPYIPYFYTFRVSIHSVFLYIPCFYTFTFLYIANFYTQPTSIHGPLLYIAYFYTYPASIHSPLLYIPYFYTFSSFYFSIHCALLYIAHFYTFPTSLYIPYIYTFTLLYISHFYTFPTFIHKELFLLKYEKSNLDAKTHRFLNCHISVNLGSLPVTYFKLHLFVQTEDDHSQLEILRKKVLKLIHTHIMSLCVFCFKVINLILLQN